MSSKTKGEGFKAFDFDEMISGSQDPEGKGDRDQLKTQGSKLGIEKSLHLKQSHSQYTQWYHGINFAGPSLDYSGFRMLLKTFPAALFSSSVSNHPFMVTIWYCLCLRISHSETR